MHIVQDKVR